MAARRTTLLIAACLAAVILSACSKRERWSAMIYSGETTFNHRDAGEFDTVEDCLKEGKKQAGEGYLECGLNCGWSVQGLVECEKTVRLVEHLEPRAPAPPTAP